MQMPLATLEFLSSRESRPRSTHTTCLPAHHCCILGDSLLSNRSHQPDEMTAKESATFDAIYDGNGPIVCETEL